MSFRRALSSRLRRGNAADKPYSEDASSHSTSTSRSSSTCERRRATAFLSYLRSNGSSPPHIAFDEVVCLMDNTAFRGSNGKWEAEFVAAVFEQCGPVTAIDLVGDVASMLGLSNEDQGEQTIEKRISPFIMEPQPGRQVRINFDDGKKEIVLCPSGENGISSDVKEVPGASGGYVARSVAIVPPGASGMFEMFTFHAEPEGWAVISDVDDTIKITQTDSATGILETTFVSEPAPVPGMPQLYSQMHTLLSPSAPWFYLSASPYSMYPFLRSFRDTHYPHGQLILRDVSWVTISGLLSSLTQGTEEYKVDRIRKIHRWLPRRMMICIGDSTQRDPEAYGSICRELPGWVKLVLIRKVTGIAAAGIKEKNEPQRFEKAFEGVPRGIWHVFEDPSECWPLVQRVVGLS
ncbi:hypothetical protein VTJ83DRAFT_7416 [Remersonia thermophila]|uniref:Phosphatidate phosphatase APP1 catalytic domain-containing protein n=1 Tax=Remersonia thermophila TaxID=72144 RepID=A0ABR4D4Z0_9PEZI